MELNEYQKKAMSTCMDSCNNISYMLLMIGEESGELQGKFSKYIRKGKIEIINNQLEVPEDTTLEEYKEWLGLVKKEIGDVLWGLAGIANVMHWSLEDVAKTNLDKLAARKKIGTIDGSGDGIERGK